MACYHNTIFYNDEDYAGYDTPLSEGGKGSDNCREILGLEFWYHFDFVAVPILPGETVEQAAYREVRKRHEFLTDENHTWNIDAAEKPHWTTRLRVIKNEHSGYFAFKPWWVDDGPGAHWFNGEYRIATVGMIEAEIAADLRRTQKYLDEAAAQKDTIRGRKQAHQLRGFANSSSWLAEVAPSRRWPQHFVNLREAKAA